MQEADEALDDGELEAAATIMKNLRNGTHYSNEANILEEWRARSSTPEARAKFSAEWERLDKLPRYIGPNH
jgi:hypothetical protein